MKIRKAVRFVLVTTAAAILATFAATALAASAAPSGNTTTHWNSLTVSTTQGIARGVQQTGYDEWLGLPYAAPPVGTRRWKPPQPAKPWPGVLAADHFGARCAQAGQGPTGDPGYAAEILSENCLYLNVYRPHDATGNLPVLFYIHGGGFGAGAGQDTDPRHFVQANHEIVVTVNYRLGIFGFLDLPHLGAGAGQFGLLDQQAALRWVHTNIASFGGDRSNVTIAGQSAGGASVCDQLTSPTAKGLFEAAVIMSGGCGMSTQASAQQAGEALAAAAGCSTNTIVCLRSASPAALIAAGGGPDPAVGGASWPIDPSIAIASGKFNRVPVMSGQTHDEQRLFDYGPYYASKHPLTAAGYNKLIRQTYGAHGNAVLAQYPVGNYSSPTIALATLQSDAGSYLRLQFERALSTWVPTYVYEFADENTPQFATIYRLQQNNAVARSFPFGATHVDDLIYLFEEWGQTVPFTDDELELSDQMTAYLGSFMRNHEPEADAGPVWQPYQTSKDAIMSFNACQTSPASSASPTACSSFTTSYSSDHKIAFWASLPS